MKRIHIALHVTDLDASARFYAALLGAPPSVRRDDYAKWLLDDPRVNLSITARGGAPGVAHLGIQADDEPELADLYAAADAAGAVRAEGHTTCCYARSEKSWVADPGGVEWEVFRTYGESETFHEAGAAPAACCADDCCTAA